MKSRLESVEDWDTIARHAQYRAGIVAQSLNVSTRQLERYFLSSRGISPRAWLSRLLVNDAMDLLVTGKKIQEIAHVLGFSTASNFTRSFHRIAGICPTAIQQRYAKFMPSRRVKESQELLRLHFDYRMTNVGLASKTSAPGLTSSLQSPSKPASWD